jgi:hypothetical protein
LDGVATLLTAVTVANARLTCPMSHRTRFTGRMATAPMMAQTPATAYSTPWLPLLMARMIGAIAGAMEDCSATGASPQPDEACHSRLPLGAPVGQDPPYRCAPVRVYDCLVAVVGLTAA